MEVFMLLKDRAALITGAASKRGIGLASAKLFAEHGCRVAIMDLDLKATQDAVASLPGTGHLAIQGNVTSKPDCERAVAEALKAFGRLDILVNNAGVTSPQRLLDVDAATYERIMDINMRGTLYMTQAAVPQMKKQGGGSIVNMSSVSAKNGGGVFGGSHYCAAKAAILGYTKATAREMGPFNIRANAICASMIATDITGGALTDEMRNRIIATVPMGRLGEAHEVAGCTLFLASDLSSYVTGSEIEINGGSHIN
jgi:NAD(P)-dependent dehydrogenase (short-subunit alcohol dehydrogenase family)